MTPLKLLLELLDVIQDLLEDGATSDNLSHARLQLDLAFDAFEELDGVDQSELGTLLDTIAIKLLEMPKALKDYFQLLDSFQVKNEKDPRDDSVEMASLVTGFLTIINDLLQTGVTPCTAHQARLQLEEQLQAFEAHENLEPTPVAFNPSFHMLGGIEEADDLLWLDEDESMERPDDDFILIPPIFIISESEDDPDDIL